ncbi:PAS and ANTAR domain-containing protein [Oerskovia flava]|uniref:PAS and ANTAR domain-containing protein n=1 Tax=Oerskovia flava TaxID=2986422 RepID=UPI00223EF627|nr:PAS and ANTAR domain-containing protein [Oerskovia sp. JB1-3-2]
MNPEESSRHVDRRPRCHGACSSARTANTTDQQVTGRWRFDLVTEQWWWSEETFHIHGFEPHEVVPTTELVLAHKHPSDRERFREVFEAAKVSGAPFHSVHRIMDARGQERVMTLVGQGRLDPATGEVVELMGYFIDTTLPLAQRAEALAGKHIRAAAAHRGAIEQAKGILTLTHGLTIAETFQLLRAISNQHNVPVRDLAARVVTLGRILPVDEHRRHAVDEFLRNPV